MSDLMSLALVLLDVTLGPLISKHMGLGLASSGDHICCQIAFPLPTVPHLVWSELNYIFN